MKIKPMYKDSEWTFPTIERMFNECEKIAKSDLQLDCYPSQIEVINSSQMIDAHASIGMPLSYQHWSYGKSFVQEEKSYRSGKSGLAYELILNSNPCIMYLMEENTATIQNVVIAHCFGHNHFFKNNYLFREWTQADSIIDYLVFAKKYISECEEKYGLDNVESLLDSAHALRTQGIDRYKRPNKLNAVEERRRREEKENYLQQQESPLWNSLAKEVPAVTPSTSIKLFPEEPMENVLKFLEKNSPTLQSWQREIIRIVRTISQYFYPQRQTKVMNEGFACYTHNYIMNKLYDKGLVTDGTMLEYLKVNAGVIYQPNWDQTGRYLNPYKLGLSIFNDIERICKQPTEEDYEWFPEIAGSNDHLNIILTSVRNYRDESFIKQFLSPKVIRDMRLFQVGDEDDSHYLIKNIHNEDGYKEIRRVLAQEYEVSRIDPNIQVFNANIDSNRRLDLIHLSVDHQTLDQKDALRCLTHIKKLWGFDVSLTTLDGATALETIKV